MVGRDVEISCFHVRLHSQAAPSFLGRNESGGRYGSIGCLLRVLGEERVAAAGGTGGWGVRLSKITASLQVLPAFMSLCLAAKAVTHVLIGSPEFYSATELPQLRSSHAEAIWTTLMDPGRGVVCATVRKER